MQVSARTATRMG